MEGWKEDVIQVHGLRLHCIRTGSGGKPGLLLLHGLTDNGRYWSRTAAALADMYDVVMLDQRGHGLSDRPVSGYSDADMAVDAAAVIQALNLAPAAVLGHSMGGAVTIVLAGTHPELMSRALLLDPALLHANNADAEHHRQRRQEWYKRHLEAKKLSEEELARLCIQQHPAWDPEDCRYWAESNLQVDPAAIVEFNVQHPWQDTIPQMRCPTLLIHGEKARGSIVDEALAADIMRHAPLVKAAPIANAGHSPQRDQFPSYIAAVRAFLSEPPRD
jgi:pimeloyl-ACP methyl ester carboxylesterase